MSSLVDACQCERLIITEGNHLFTKLLNLLKSDRGVRDSEWAEFIENEELIEEGYNFDIPHKNKLTQRERESIQNDLSWAIVKSCRECKKKDYIRKIKNTDFKINESEYIKRRIFFELFNWDYRLRQFFDSRAENFFLEKVVPKVAKLIKKSTMEFMEEYLYYVDHFLEIYRKFDDKMDSDSFTYYGKEIGVILFFGIENYKQWLEADFDNGPLDEVDLSIDGGYLTTILGGGYLGASIEIGKFCKVIKNSGFEFI